MTMNKVSAGNPAASAEKAQRDKMMVNWDFDFIKRSDKPEASPLRVPYVGQAQQHFRETRRKSHFR